MKFKHILKKINNLLHHIFSIFLSYIFSLSQVETIFSRTSCFKRHTLHKSPAHLRRSKRNAWNSLRSQARFSSKRDLLKPLQRQLPQPSTKETRLTFLYAIIPLEIKTVPPTHVPDNFSFNFSLLWKRKKTQNCNMEEVQRVAQATKVIKLNWLKCVR